MKKLKVYDVYVDDSENVYKVTVPAENVVAAKRYVHGNGEIVAVKDCNLQDIDIGCLTTTLYNAHWGRQEVEVICRTLQACGLDRQ